MYGNMRQQQQQQQQYNTRGYPQQGQFQQGQWGGGGMGGYGVAQQQGAMPAYQAAAGFQAGYGQQTGATAAAGSAGQANFQQQQQQQWQQQQGQYGQQQAWGQQQMGWGQEQGQQWAGQHSWAGGAAGATSPRAAATAPNPNMYPMVPQQQQPMAKVEAAKRVDAPKTAATTGEGMQPETYQRTLEYVQQCQSWSSPTNPDYTGVMSPDSSSVKGAANKQKSSPGHSGDSQAMPPPSRPPPIGEPSKPVQEGGNMVIADMSSSLNTLMEENRYLHMMQ